MKKLLVMALLGLAIVAGCSKEAPKQNDVESGAADSLPPPDPMVSPDSI